MIISSNQAQKIVSNHSVLQKVPELLAAVEEWKAADRTWQAKKNCKTCNKAQIFSGVEQNALDAIRGLSKDAVGRLKAHLGEKTLYIYEPISNGKPRMIEL